MPNEYEQIVYDLMTFNLFRVQCLDTGTGIEYAINGVLNYI